MTYNRHSGILLHPTSLPGRFGSGDLGPAAYHFVDWLVAGGQTLWQILPLGGIGPGNSPYMSPSAFAGNELLIDLEHLRDCGWLTDADIAPGSAVQERPRQLPGRQIFPHVPSAVGCGAILHRPAPGCPQGFSGIFPARVRLARRLCTVHGARRPA